MRWLDLVPMTTARVTIQEIGDGRPGCHGEVSHDAPADSAGVVTDRHSYEAEGGETVRSGKPYWFSHETKHWRAQRFKSLSRCLNPNYRKPK